ncbi:uncharacterized protein LOC130776626 isoform X2 [Actinidia eriantha]|uniref:uncharacterized protein LOC130776626 isoform X2 n=1 Tax=Actinidia eriantha TaxID=165200 RepID=UPI0025849EFB|nr:uncharacterized protein LOC130776626 isoform X2 [Actinidia eriantha]
MESGGSPKSSSPEAHKPQPNPTTSTLQDVLMMVTNSETLILDKILIYLKEMGFTGEEKNSKIIIVLMLIRDGFKANLCTTSWLTTFERPSLFEFTVEYKFVDVMVMDMSHGGEAVRLIVDMDFRSQFELARPTSTYLKLLISLPDIFVGTEEKLMSVVSLLCSAAKQSLKERGLKVPPWRKAKYMQSKWLSDNCKKIPSGPFMRLNGISDNCKKIPISNTRGL